MEDHHTANVLRRQNLKQSWQTAMQRTYPTRFMTKARHLSRIIFRARRGLGGPTLIAGRSRWHRLVGAGGDGLSAVAGGAVGISIPLLLDPYMCWTGEDQLGCDRRWKSDGSLNVDRIPT